MKDHLRSWDDKLKAECPDAKANKAKQQCVTRLAIEQALTIDDAASLSKKLSELRRKHAPKLKAPTLNELKAHLRSWDDKLKAECPDAKANKTKPCLTRLAIEQALTIDDAASLSKELSELRRKHAPKLKAPTLNELKARLRS